MKWAIQAKEEEKKKPQTFSADGWTGNQWSSQMWWRNEQELLSPEPRTARTSELNGSGGGRGKGIRGPRIKCPPFVPVGVSNRDKTPWPPYPFVKIFDSLPEPFSSLVLTVLGSGERSSYSFLHHICEDLWFPVHPSALKVWGLFFSSSLACVAHCML